MSSGELALFRAYPALEKRLPRHPLVTVPTPVEAFPLPGVPEGAIFVKRDDQSCDLYGGNKPRKLEFILGEARAAGARRLVTTGGLGTHHGLATTITGRAAGLATSLILVRQPLTSEVRKLLLLDHAYGARLIYAGNVPGAVCWTAAELVTATLRRERPYLVSTGGSSPTGNVGFVSAGLELAEQIRSAALPEPAEIYVAVGTGGTLVGLSLGLRLAGLETRLVGVLVTDILPPSPRRLARAARALSARLRRLDPSVSASPVRSGDFALEHGQLGAGYGAPTRAGRDALAAAAESGLRLETTYTAKCLAALRERMQRGDGPGGPVLFWNTYNGVDVAAGAPARLDPAALPKKIRRVLAGPDAECDT